MKTSDINNNRIQSNININDRTYYSCHTPKNVLNDHIGNNESNFKYNGRQLFTNQNRDTNSNCMAYQSNIYDRVGYYDSKNKGNVSRSILDQFSRYPIRDDQYIEPEGQVLKKFMFQKPGQMGLISIGKAFMNSAKTSVSVQT